MKPGQLSVGPRDSQSAYRIWGLTGGVAAGKSLAAQYLREAGIPVINADEIGRELSQKGGAAHGAIFQRFGTADRAELRKRIFSDPVARRDLEAILHPLIRVESFKRMQTIAERDKNLPFIVYEAALLIESGQAEGLEGLIVIDAPVELRKQRLVWRDKIAPELADRIIASQVTDEERRRVATILIDNTGSREDLRRRIQAAIDKISGK